VKKRQIQKKQEKANRCRNEGEHGYKMTQCSGKFHIVPTCEWENM